LTLKLGWLCFAVMAGNLYGFLNKGFLNKKS
jgi:hypothetical protein